MTTFSLRIQYLLVDVYVMEPVIRWFPPCRPSSPSPHLPNLYQPSLLIYTLPLPSSNTSLHPSSLPTSLGIHLWTIVCKIVRGGVVMAMLELDSKF